MSRRASAPGLGERLRRVRIRLGHQNLADFARALGVHYMTYRKWELLGSTPSPHTLKHAIRLLDVQQWELLFSWLCDGVGELPWWFEKNVEIPKADDPLPEGVAFVGKRGLRSLTNLPADAAIQLTGELPVLSIGLLAQRAREARERGLVAEAEAAEVEIAKLVLPHVLITRPRATRPGPSRENNKGNDSKKDE